MPASSISLPPFMSLQVAEARRFYLPTFPKPGDGPCVVSGGWERCARDYKIRRSGFPYFTVEFVVGGRGTLHIGGRAHALVRGTVFAYGPRVAHTITTDPAHRLSKYFVNFFGRGAAAAMREAGIAAGACHAVAVADEVQAAFEHLLTAGRRGTQTAARVAALQGRILLLMVSEVRLPSGTHESQSLQTFRKCQNFLEENFASVNTAEEIAAACHVAPAYLSRLFRRFAGQPAYRFLMRLKMNHAATLLEQERLMVREVADAFAMDPFHFSRAFKRVHGLSPVAFLRNRNLG